MEELLKKSLTENPEEITGNLDVNKSLGRFLKEFLKNFQIGIQIGISEKILNEPQEQYLKKSL